jgi:uncharacterized protein YbjQ (UPF0145 family)
MAVMTGLSGNEIYCLHLKGLRPGDLVIGNSVFSMGFLGSLGAGVNTFLGGEVAQVTSIIHEGRIEAFKRMISEASERGGVGITGVTNELRQFHGNTEFLSVASCVHDESGASSETIRFSASANGQELYCQMDCGFRPVQFVFGNIAYSIGAAGGLLGGLKSMARGEIREFSDVFNRTRHLCLARIIEEAQRCGANAVVGIETRTLPFQGCHEMLMLGTASHHPQLPAVHMQQPISSDLTNEEMWNLVSLGYLPLKLVLGTAVYSLGVMGNLKAAFKSLSRGEVSDLTTLVYDAREHAIGLIQQEADAIGADDVVGIKTYIHEIGNNLIEFMAIGTAIKKASGVKTDTPGLPPQAIIRDRDTWVGEGFNVSIRNG